MKSLNEKKSIYLLLFIILANYISYNDNLVKPENQSPLLLSLSVFPKVVKPSDSLIVICNATDPDGDTLAYDWITTGVVKIKGYNHPWLYNTAENSRIFYAPDSAHVSVPKDTFWVQCFARDGKGMSDAKTIRFVVVQNSSRGATKISNFIV